MSKRTLGRYICLSIFDLILLFIIPNFVFVSLLNSVLDKERSSEIDIASPDVQKNIFGLARIGSRTALNFAFAFLRRAWRSG